MSVQIKMIGTGEEYLYAPSSKGGLGALSKLMNQYGRHRQQHPSEFPIVRLGGGSYETVRYGTVQKPKIPIVGWRTETELIGVKVDSTPATINRDDVDSTSSTINDPAQQGPLEGPPIEAYEDDINI